MVKKILFEDPKAAHEDAEKAYKSWISLKNRKEALSETKIQELLTYLVRTKSFASNDHQLQLLDSIFDSIYQSIVCSSGLGDYKIISCDTLVVWLSRSIQLISKSKAHPDELVKVKTVLQAHITFDVAQYLFHYVLDFWNDSGAALGNSLKELFIKQISFLSCCNTEKVNNEIFTSWLIKSMEIPYSMRVFYFMIENLYKEVDSVDFVLAKHPNFIRNSLDFIWSNALASSVGKVVFLIIRHCKSKYQTEADWVHSWADDIISGIQNLKLKKGMESYLLPNLFKISPSATMIFLKYVISNYKEDISTTLSCLKIAQETSILIEPFLPSVDGDEPVIDIETIKILLTSTNASYRISAFSLLVSSPKLSKQIPSVVYKCVFDTLDSIFVDNDLETRNEMFSYVQKFTNRIRDSTYALDRDATSLTKKNFERFELEIQGKRNAIVESQSFFKDLLAYLNNNIKPGSSYQRKEMSFRILTMLIRSSLDNRVNKKYLEKAKTVDFVYSLAIYDSLLLRLLIDNIADDFEDIRTYATQILHMCPLLISEMVQIDTIQNRALLLLGDMKGKSVDSGARFFQFIYGYYQNINEVENCQKILDLLLNKLEKSIQAAQNDICEACYTSSIQGYFAAFKFIFEIMNFKLLSQEFISKLIDQLISLSQNSWDQIKPILQHDSPEGNLPEQLKEKYSEELELKYGKGTQVILSYSWRALKESTTMIDVLLKASMRGYGKNKTQNNSKVVLIKDSCILTLGALIIEQLATIRHRGAFSSVYPTFVSCCSLCILKEELKHLPKKWLDENIDLIQVRSKYITRRSAGVPYLITAILTSSKDLIDETFHKLYMISSLPLDENIIKEATMNNVNLPQVNAFNCIKVLFIDSQLSDESIYYVDKALTLALEAIASPIWSIRNCAVMLFTALQNRLFSSKKVRNNRLPSYPARLFFNKFKSVKKIFFDTLRQVYVNKEINSNELEKIFPILTIMSRLEPTPDYNGLKDFKELILGFLSSNVWKVREMAARSFPAIIASRNEFKNEFIQLLTKNGYWGVDSNGKCNWNSIHGSLLAQKELLERADMDAYNDNNKNELLLFDKDIRSNIIRTLSFGLNTCPWEIKLAIFQILEIIKIGTFSEERNQIKSLKEWFLDNYDLKTNEKLSGSKQLALKVVSKLLFNYYFLNDDQTELADLLELSMFSKTYEVQLSSIEFISDNLNSLKNQTYSKLVNDCWELVGRKDVWKHVKAKALLLIKNLNIEKEKEVNDIPLIIKHTNQLIKTSTEDFNQEIELTTLETLGTYIARLLIHDLKGNQDLFIDWIKKLKIMTDDDQEVHIRSAALESLIGFNKIFQSYETNDNSKTIEEYKFVILGLIFNYLTDDDDSLAFKASEHFSNDVLKIDLNIGNILPVEIEKRIISYVVELVNKMPFLREILFAFGSKDNWYNNVFNLFDEIDLKTLLLPNDLLFGSEKRNLDRDMTIKSHELIQLINETYDNTSFWDEKLEPLKKKLEMNLDEINQLILHDETNGDGPLGSLSQESLFDFVYNTLLVGKCLVEKFEITLEHWEFVCLIVKGDDQWHELVFRLIK